MGFGLPARSSRLAARSSQGSCAWPTIREADAGAGRARSHAPNILENAARTCYKRHSIKAGGILESDTAEASGILGGVSPWPEDAAMLLPSCASS